MFDHGLDLGAASGLFGVAAHLALLLPASKVLVQRGKGQLVSFAFMAAVLSTIAWAGLDACAQQGGWWPKRHWLLATLLPALDVLRYAAWYVVLFGMIGAAVPGRMQRLRGVLPVTALAVVSGALGLLLVREFGDLPLASTERWQSFSMLALAVTGLLLVEQILRNASGDARWGVKPLFLGLGAVFAFDLFLFSQAALFSVFDSDALSIRAAVHASSVPLLWMAAVRNRQWLGRLHVSRAAAFHSASLLLVGGYLMLVSGVGYYVRYTGGEWGRALQQALTSVAAVVLLMVAFSGSMRARLRVYISKNFFSYRYDYREEWLRFTAMLGASSSPQQLAESVVQGLANMVESPAGALWLRRGSDAAVQQFARWNLLEEKLILGAESDLITFLQQKDWIVDLGEWRRTPERYPGLVLPDGFLIDERYWLIVPLQCAGSFLGFVVLAEPRTNIELNWEVRDLLRTAGSQAAGNLMQMQATEALLEARKFEAFNRMSAFVVHDLKNIVTQLSLMLKNAKRLQGNPEFRQDMLDTVENSLEKMRQLMLQLRDGEKPHGLTGGVDLVAIAKRLKQSTLSKGRDLELRVRQPLSTRGVEDRIQRVIGHVVQNALDATPADGRVWLELDQVGSHARVEVGDTGCGMTAEFIEHRLFRAFQTTKVSGMGIGAYESFQYLQELGGKIDVESELNKGTKITIWLPLFRSDRATGLVEAVGQ